MARNEITLPDFFNRIRPEAAVTPVQGRGPLRLSTEQTVPFGTLANGVRRQRPFPGECDFCGVWDCADRPQSVTDDRRSSVFRSEPNTKMSAVQIALTGNAPSKADLNTEFPRFLRGRSNQNAD
jgi:hypothetical protein